VYRVSEKLLTLGIFRDILYIKVMSDNEKGDYIMRKDVTDMTKNELSAIINVETHDLELVKACIKERDKRTNEFIQERLQVGA